MNTARLLIHAGQDALPTQGGALERSVRGLMERAWHALQPVAAVLAALRIDDLSGRRFFAAEQAVLPIDLPLPAGTYHVTVDIGPQHRRYTVTLEPGASVHLHVCPTLAPLPPPA